MDESMKRPPYLIISILMVGAFIAFLNNTLLNVALPSIMEDLGVNMATVQWLTTGFMLVNGIMIPTTAYLIQKYTVRGLFLTSIGLFTIGTIVAAVAPVFSFLLFGRMLQASGSAILMPLLMNVLLVSFPISRRGTIMGFLGLILTFAPAIGPTLSGWIIQHFNWRALFTLIAPISIICFVLGFILLRDRKEKVDLRLDKLSLVLSSVGFGSLLYGFSSAGNVGWGNPEVITTIVVGIVALFVFVIYQNRMASPMLDFRIFKYPMYSLSVIISMIVNMALFSGFMLIPVFAQNIINLTPMQAGILLLPGALVNGIMSPINGKLFDRFGGRLLAVLGLTILTVTTFMFSHLSFETTMTELAILHVARMFGLSMVMMPVQTNGLNQLPVNKYPHGTAMNNTLNQVAGAIGTALLITILSIRTKFYTMQLINESQRMGEVLTDAKMEQIGLEAMLDGINDTFFVSAIIIVFALILACFMKRVTQENQGQRHPSKNVDVRPATQK
ncbi:DHA2 family efflux MFS transporter permease subunit [Caldibacillus thermolactis]|jgi:EmrB/QacA subfamily drug resistance transporter|uniref:DHA2 family efflux MFS transporter permease subunit n=1 Tax=Pallidibacillus thermolactis TaxID=251051 RepID=A0ABT2WFH1_9BACI|nr:DHA2 family efflux MFS transporter permease subunit [Pallidibacillus thermolactis]MCU9594423.1 DHA2 family efflux MFS transporter permease subunit [Pallidibacillus thermolactis]MCU9601210.1 DHA2 family efflux MFS transporter permease subunit [Pallidibacillus thermolactis subsp. kokeshiiformis]MED1672360.1 DHA2 family efflux MFS transporter permease subunit [Pallidibacillus thermolactis subsp. kokeshiiformis]